MKRDNEQKIHHELDTILKFSALINSSFKIEVILENAMKWAEEFIDAEASTIYEIDDSNNELFVRFARGEKKEPTKNIRLNIGEGIAGHVVKTGKAMVVQDVLKEPRFDGRFDKITGFKTKSMICVPLERRDQITGALQVLNKRHNQPFSREDLELLTSMAQQIAIAIENARLYRRLEQRFELTSKELRLIQGKLIHSERLAAIGHLVNGVAHEIRNPIMTIGGFAHRIKVAACDDEKLIEYSDIILSETARLEKLVKKVHEFIDIQTAFPHPEYVQTVINETINRFMNHADKQGIRIITHIGNDIPMINIDSSQMILALSNIVENALESTSNGGKIEIGVTKQDQNVIFEISDTGSGIAKGELDSVYDPFFTSKASSVGLGLTMVNQIVMNHNGEIKIRSHEFEGTVVTITLPIIRNQNQGVD